MVECIVATPDLLGNYWGGPAFRPVVDSSLVLWMTGDFGNTEIWTDLSGKGNHGTINGAARTPLHPLGIFGSVLDLNGIDNYVDCGNTTSLNGEFSALTLVAWIKPAGDVDLQPKHWGIVANSDTWSNKGFVWELSPYGGNIEFNAGNGTTDDLMLTGNLPWDPTGNTWYYVAVVWDGITTYFYRNGAMIGSETWTLGGNIAAMATESCVIGAYDSGKDRHFSGIIGEVLIYNRNLSDMDIIHNYMHSPIYYIQKGII